MKILKEILLAITFVFAILIPYYYTNGGFVGVALPQATAVFETSLQSRITASATSMTLTENSIRGGGSLSGYNCFTIDEDSPQAETVCGTVSGTSVTGLVRGISQSTGTTTVASLQHDHRRGSNVKITDYPVIQLLKAMLNGEDTIPNLITYANTVLIDSGSASTTLATKYYVDSVSVSGASDASETVRGISELATQIEMASSTQVGGTGANLVCQAKYATSTPSGTSYSGLYAIISKNNGKLHQLWLDLTEAFTWTGTHIFSGLATFNGATSFTATSTATANTIGFNPQSYVTASTTFTGDVTPTPAYMATSTGAFSISDANVAIASKFDGFVVSSGVNGGSVLLQTSGVVDGFTGLTTGSEYYVQDTVGTIGTTVGTSEVYVGDAISSTQLLIKTRSNQYISSGSFADITGTHTVSVPFYTKSIVISYVVSSDFSNSGTAYLEKNGITSARVGDTCDIGTGNCTSTGYITITFNPTLSTLTIVQSGTIGGGTATAYFYR